eukprot:10118-Heterococcus_DN1.PRE.3
MLNERSSSSGLVEFQFEQIAVATINKQQEAAAAIFTQCNKRTHNCSIHMQSPQYHTTYSELI